MLLNNFPFAAKTALYQQDKKKNNRTFSNTNKIKNILRKTKYEHKNVFRQKKRNTELQNNYYFLSILDDH